MKNVRGIMYFRRKSQKIQKALHSLDHRGVGIAKKLENVVTIQQ